MITIICDNNQHELPKGSTVFDLALQLKYTEPHQAVGCKINGVLKDLSTPLHDQDTVELIHFEDKAGKEIFWHTSAHILAQAILRLWPDAKPAIGPPIEEGFYYDFDQLEISEEDFSKIDAMMKKIIAENHKTEKKEIANASEALKLFGENPYKKEIIEGLEGPITAYEQGEFIDLCRGPHLPALNKVKAIKVLKTSGAYWRGDPTNNMLTRVYAISFPDKKELQAYLKRLEEAKKRDHRLLGQKLDLFSFKEHAPGFPFIHPKGMIVWNTLLEFYRRLHAEAGYQEIKTPMMLSKHLWEISGHWEHYKQNMYVSEIEKDEYAIKPMNCPGCMLYYNTHVHSYKEFPLRVGEIGLVHRNEASGALSGLMRVRAFHQDDAHIFLTEDQIEEEILNVLNLIDVIYSTFGLEYRFELSTRPEKQTVGTDEQWEVSTHALKQALEKNGQPFVINEGDGAFYGPKIDIHIKDCLGRHWQCGTIQLDMSLPQRFNLKYDDKHGSESTPVMLHRALFGSIERFLGILIEHFAGRFPLWLSPRQVAFIPVADRHAPKAQELSKYLSQHGFHVECFDQNESVSKKIRIAQLLQFNYMITLGDEELESETLSLRTREGVQEKGLSVQDFTKRLIEEKESYALSSLFKEVPH